MNGARKVRRNPGQCGLSEQDTIGNGLLSEVAALERSVRKVREIEKIELIGVWLTNMLVSNRDERRVYIHTEPLMT